MGSVSQKRLWGSLMAAGVLITTFQNCTPSNFIANVPSTANGSNDSASVGTSPTPVGTSPTPSSTATPTATPPSTIPSQFPSAANTGIPAGTVLSNYTGPCNITVANTVIDSKTINCDLSIKASGVVIKKSKINGVIDSGDDKTKNYSFRVEDSEIDATPGFAAAATALGSINFTVIRTHVYGGNRGANCWYNCLIQDSYFHGQDTDNSGTWHESGIRMGQNGTIRHNTIICDAPDVPPDAGCSAALTGYGDFAPVQNMLIENNYFPPTTGGFCSYGGSSKGKPYSNDASNIVFKDNLYQKGQDGRLCGYWGPVTDFDDSAPGNQWTNNKWTDGSTINP